MDAHMKTELVVDALEILEMAVCRRKPSAGLVHHPDRGAQYTAISFGKRLEGGVGILFLRWEGPEPPWTQRLV